MCIFCVLDALASGASLIQGEATPLRVSQFLELDSSGSIPFICKLINPEQVLQTTSSIWILHSKSPYPYALITSHAGTGQLGTTPIAQSPPKLFKLTNLKLALLLILPHPFLPVKTIIKAFAHAFPLLSLPPD